MAAFSKFTGQTSFFEEKISPWVNQGRFITKDLHKVITKTARKEYRKQRNICNDLLQKVKKNIRQNSMYLLSQTTKVSGKLWNLFSEAE